MSFTEGRTPNATPIGFYFMRKWVGSCEPAGNQVGDERLPESREGMPEDVRRKGRMIPFDNATRWLTIGHHHWSPYRCATSLP
ncbi:hypothetical protein ACFFWE_01365 [Sphaerisporangium melleum]|uniref:hypothetical protein n=1 Tax=Sphaerisporangium melleum TaxID=321316 RepID=UPI00166E9D5E|nr:hypothetical protein [Sphaerisporangium melleum]